MAERKILSLLLFFALAAPSVAFAWEPTPQQVEGAQGQAEGYFNFLTDGDFGGAHGLLSPSAREQISARDYRSHQIALFKRYGEVVERDFLDFDWQPGASDVGTGVAAILPYSGKTGTGTLVCGELFLVEALPGLFMIDGEDTVYLEPDSLADLDTDQRRALAERPGCRGLIEE